MTSPTKYSLALPQALTSSARHQLHPRPRNLVLMNHTSAAYFLARHHRRARPNAKFHKRTQSRIRTPELHPPPAAESTSSPDDNRHRLLRLPSAFPLNSHCVRRGLRRRDIEAVTERRVDRFHQRVSREERTRQPVDHSPQGFIHSVTWMLSMDAQPPTPLRVPPWTH